VLKAGAAFVPLEPDLPARRRAELLDAVQAVAVVCGAEATAQDVAGRALVDLTRLAAMPSTDPWLPVAARNLAYVMHTSGSTGEPKGVAVEHRSILRLVCGVRYAALGPDACVLHAAPPAFDAATFEIWGALLNGGTCAVLPVGVPTAATLARAIRDSRASIAWLTASLFNSVVDEDPDALRGLRELLIGGEALSPAHVDAAQRALPGLAIVNGYGPTENTTFSTTQRIPRLNGALEPIPIGRPIEHGRALILDAQLEPVAPGVLGELCVGGDGLARGYFARPGLTAARFVPDPFGAGERLYRTGDLARWRADGSIAYAGRRDAQLKLRGHRIETGEIEARLRAHPAVSEAAVVLVGAGAPQARLVAYVTAREPGALDERVLREALAAELPRWMVPSAIVRLSEIPRTRSGKLDRGALPAPERTGRAAPLPPRDALETALCALFTELLAQPELGIRDDFFDLGGHSLLATQLVARIAAQHGCALPVEAVFLAPTVEQLAARVREAGSGSAAAATAIQRRPRVARQAAADEAEVHG
jgi:amino acid adenylation domain-containing protein